MKIPAVLAGLTVALLPLAALSALSVAEAHRDGCHRWHSCPSDSGSYVCGDLGYTSGCPTEAPAGRPTPRAAPARPAVRPAVPARPRYAARGVNYVAASALRRVGSVDKLADGWYRFTVGRSVLSVKPGSAIAKFKSGTVRLAAMPYLHAGALYVPAASLRLLGCSLDTAYLPVALYASCGGATSTFTPTFWR